MKTFIVTFVFLVSVQIGWGQNYKFGKVSEDDFEQFSKPQDPSDNATVIYKYQSIRFEYQESAGFVQINEVHERIIIHNKEGFDWATKRVRLYNESNSRSESVNGLKGYTYNLEGGQVNSEKLRKENVFEEVANKYWKYQTFTMPNVKEGCIIEYTYEVNSPFTHIDDIEMQYSVPILKFELSIKTPEYYIFNKMLNPKASYIPSFSETRDTKTITFNTKERVQTSRYITRTNFDQSKINYQENIIVCNATNIPALRSEPMVDNIDNYKAKLILELTAVKWPDEPIKSFSSTWEKVAKTIYDDEDFGNQLDRTGFYGDDLELLIAGETNQQKKAQLVYEFVKSKVKWNGFYGYTADNGVRKAFMDGSGNVADINLLLVSMLRKAGIRTNPVLVSTKDNGIPLFPTRSGFNYVICLIEDGDFNALLDATEPFGTFNIIPFRAHNWQGRVIRENGTSEWIPLDVKEVSKEITYLNASIDLENLSIRGSVRNQYTTYGSFDYRGQFANMSDEDRTKYLEKSKGDILIEELSVENDEEIDQPIKQTYNFELNDALEEIGGKYYFNPMLFLANLENPFKQETRNFPINIRYPNSEKIAINVMLPEGITVESIPESSLVEFNGGTGKFSYVIRANPNGIQLSVSLDVLMPFVFPEEYSQFKAFYQEIVDKESEQVVLIKA